MLKKKLHVQAYRMSTFKGKSRENLTQGRRRKKRGGHGAIPSGKKHKCLLVQRCTFLTPFK